MKSTAGLDPYDALAPYYRDFSARKAKYLSAVDAFILQHASKGPSALLDVGSGDGVRGMALARGLEAHRVVLADLSAEMVARCRELGADEVWQCAAEALPQTEQRFDVILCLWNVLGHVSNGEARIEALRRMSRLLAPGGKLFFDVNNRHNAAAYGRWRVIARRLVDAVFPDERRGDATFDWHIGNCVFPAKGHLFTPREIRFLIEAAGLDTETQVTINYADGTISQTSFDGQLLFVARKKNE